MSEKLISIDGIATIPGLFWHRVKTHADSVAIREKDFGIWNEITWEQYGDQARLVGLGLKALGMKRGDICSIASEVNKEWLFADLGIICAGGVCNGVYPTDAPNQVEYLISDSATRFYFAEDEEQLDKVLEVRERTPTLEKIIIFDMEGLRSFKDEQCISMDQLMEAGREYLNQHPDEWQAEIDAASPSDLMILTYTSGTTGMPKGAMISQRNMLFMLHCLKKGLDAREGDEQLGFLPLAHIAGRLFYTFSPLESLAVVNLVESLETTVQDLQEVSPTMHFAVPRVWEKQYSTVAIKLKEATALGRFAYERAIAIGYRASAYRKQNQSPPLHLRLLNSIADLIVFRNVRKMLGINSSRRLFTAAAPIAPDLIDWYWALNRPMFEIYGQTECTGIVTANTPEACRVGSVGKPISDVEVKLSEQGEILVRCPSVVTGYWRKPEKTAETIIDGWLHTGDVGRIDDDGFIYLIDRMKDIIITAGGKLRISSSFHRLFRTPWSLATRNPT